MITLNAAVALAGAYVLLLVAIMASDILRRRIPNWAVLALLAVFAVAAILGQSPAPLSSALAGAGIALAVGVGLYAMGWVGAGDAKLFAVLGLFTGLAQLGPLALYTALAGGLMAIGLLVFRTKNTLAGLTARGRAEGKGRSIPYGVAIGLAALAVAWNTGFIPGAG